MAINVFNNSETKMPGMAKQYRSRIPGHLIGCCLLRIFFTYLQIHTYIHWANHTDTESTKETGLVHL